MRTHQPGEKDWGCWDPRRFRSWQLSGSSKLMQIYPHDKCTESIHSNIGASPPYDDNQVFMLKVLAETSCSDRMQLISKDEIKTGKDPRPCQHQSQQYLSLDRKALSDISRFQSHVAQVERRYHMPRGM